MSNYLKLTAEENAVYNRMLEKVKPKEREVVMQYTNEWIEEGVKKGLQQGLQKGRQEGRQEARQEARDLVRRQLRRQVGALPPKLSSQIDCLNDDDMMSLGDALLDFNGSADLKRWLSQRAKETPT